jgi:ATP-dependent Clp protease ATP-binding subunit ClpA
VNLKTARQRAKAEQNQGPTATKLVIEQVGQVMDALPIRPAYEADAAVAHLAGVLTGRVPRSVLLIAAAGSGKTAVVGELVRRKKTLRLADTPFWSTSGARLIAGMSGFGMWQQRCQQLCREAAHARAILHLGSLVELMQVGRLGSSGGIAGFFRPYMNRGDILIIAECTPEQLSVIERMDPHLLELFHQLRIEEPDAATGRRILSNVATESGHPVDLDQPWLATLDRLHRRYATYSAYPGRPVRFLQNLLRDLKDGHSPTSSDVIDAFARETGLPRFMLDGDVQLDLSAAHDWFTSRLIGQNRAVALVVDLLATVKAALARPRRPIASLLFVGPTGVGKTEMAKALAEYFFADRARLTRFDMSEFSNPAAVDRLIGGSFGSEGLLTSKVREQPFSVILFDEFEKAHPAFFDLLLQVLGEGRLTDSAGRVGDFSNTIVVMTSNLGAESYGRGTFGLNQNSNGGYADLEKHFTDEVRAFVRPELFNRIDRIVPFSPLNHAMIAQIARRELSLVQQRDGIKLRGIDLQLTDDAINHLIKKGYDIRYGARPLKRAIERELLAPLSAQINSYLAQVPLEAIGDTDGNGLTVDVRGATGRDSSNQSSGENAISRAADDCASLRREAQKCQKSAAMLSITNQLFRLEREQQRQEKRRRAKDKPAYDAARAQRIRELRTVADELEEIRLTVNELEDGFLTAFYSRAAATSPLDLAAIPTLRARFDALLLLLLSMQSTRPHNAVLGILGRGGHVQELAAAYLSVAQTFSYAMQACWYSNQGRDRFVRHPITDIGKYVSAPDASAVGIAISFRGQYAGLRFSPEAGIHGFVQGTHRTLCIVESVDVPLAQYVPMPVKNWPTEISGSTRRMYHLNDSVLHDDLLNAPLTFSARDFKPTIARAIELQLRIAAEAVIDS